MYWIVFPTECALSLKWALHPSAFQGLGHCCGTHGSSRVPEALTALTLTGIYAPYVNVNGSPYHSLISHSQTFHSFLSAEYRSPPLADTGAADVASHTWAYDIYCIHMPDSGENRTTDSSPTHMIYEQYNALLAGRD